MRDGYGRWLPSQWQKLMELTLRAIDSVKSDGALPPYWRIGGSTSLSIDLGHRISYDIDVFTDSARVIKQLVPIGNAITRDICWDVARQTSNYQFHGHHLKLIVSGMGEIGVVSASSLVHGSITELELDGRVIDRDRPCEVIARMLYCRGPALNSRDVFDLAGCFLMMPEELSDAARSIFMTPEIYERARLRIRTRVDALQEDMSVQVNPTDFGKSYMENACELALEAIDFMQRG